MDTVILEARMAYLELGHGIHDVSIAGLFIMDGFLCS
jgi:hypothetical protein